MRACSPPTSFWTMRVGIAAALCAKWIDSNWSEVQQLEKPDLRRHVDGASSENPVQFIKTGLGAGALRWTNITSVSRCESSLTRLGPAIGGRLASGALGTLVIHHHSKPNPMMINQQRQATTRMLNSSLAPNRSSKRHTIRCIVDWRHQLSIFGTW